MAKCEIIREDPIPQTRPIKDIVLHLSLEEAVALKMLTGSFTGKGLRDIISKIYFSIPFTGLGWDGFFRYGRDSRWPEANEIEDTNFKELLEKNK